jgi:predicted nucleic acid-binding protein
MPDKVYWDACAWLGLVNSEPKKVPPLEYFFDLAKRGHLEIWTSAISYVEVYHLASETKPFEKDGLDIIKEAIEAPFVKIIPLDMEVGRKARGLRRNHTLRAPDAVHLASALVRSISPMHTWDRDDLVKLDDTLSCKDAERLRIRIPEIPPPPPGTLFSTAQQ